MEKQTTDPIRISVVTPVFNGERFIERCLQEVIKQDCRNLEHIIMDGGSKDRTVEIIKDYAARYPHIRWRSAKDNGQSNAMNKAIREAKGDVLSILNADDYYEPEVLNKVQERFRTMPVPSLLVGNCRIVDESGNLKWINKPDVRFFQILQPWRYMMPMNPVAYFYHRALHDRIGLYDENNHYAMDMDFLLKAIPASHVKYVDETLGNMRMYPGTKTHDSFADGTIKGNIQNLARHHARRMGLPYRIYVASSIWMENNRQGWDAPTLSFRAKWKIYNKSWQWLDTVFSRRETAS